LRLRHCRERVRSGRWVELAGEVTRHLLSEGRMRRLYLWGHARALFRERIPAPRYPDWLNPDFERRCELRARYEQVGGGLRWDQGPAGAVRPEAYGLMSSPIWPGLFEEYDPDNVGRCAELRHPFFDLRLARYVLSLPALPWCSDKELLRRSMRGLLPHEIRLARKRPILHDLLMAHYANGRKPWLESFESAEGLGQYVDVEKMLHCLRGPRPWELRVHLNALVLNFWLKWESRFAYRIREEECRV